MERVIVGGGNAVLSRLGDSFLFSDYRADGGLFERAVWVTFLQAR
jgi:hypothetical protein